MLKRSVLIGLVSFAAACARKPPPKAPTVTPASTHPTDDANKKQPAEGPSDEKSSDQMRGDPCDGGE